MAFLTLSLLSTLSPHKYTIAKVSTVRTPVTTTKMATSRRKPASEPDPGFPPGNWTRLLLKIVYPTETQQQRISHLENPTLPIVTRLDVFSAVLLSINGGRREEKLTAVNVAGKYASAIKLAFLMARESFRAFCVTQNMAFDSSDATDAKLAREKILECTREPCRWERILKSCIMGEKGGWLEI